MNRRDKILKHVDKAKRGVEIGPSHDPVAPKSGGYAVDVIDHVNREELIEKYRGHGVKLDAIEEVDFVWNGQSYVELTGRPKFYGWIIASHVIEHSPDLISFLNQCDSILEDDGVLSLAVPDKRYCFDYFRPLTGLASIIDAHRAERTLHSPGTVAEYFMNVCKKGGQIAWSRDTGGKHSLVHTKQDAIRGMETASNGGYLDVHAWCFTPQSFRLIVHDLHALGMSPFQEVDYFPTEAHEFFVTLGRNGKGIRDSRLDLLKRIQAELAEARSGSVKHGPGRPRRRWGKPLSPHLGVASFTAPLRREPCDSSTTSCASSGGSAS